MKLFCIPYAGGSANVYWDWKSRLMPYAQVIMVEYKGHGSLFSQTPYQTIQEAAEDIVQRYLLENTEPYVLYGHSLGSLVTFEIEHLLIEKRIRQPEHIVLSAMRPPHLLYKKKRYTHLPKEIFMQHIFELGNTPHEILEDKELRDLFYEILFSYIKLVENYHCNIKLDCIHIPISVFLGLEDEEAPKEDLLEWAQYTKNEFALNAFTGNHFFAFHEPGKEAVYAAMKEILKKYNGISIR